MQKLRGAQLNVEGGKVIDVYLQHPLTRLNHYQDIAIIAFPTLPNEKRQAEYEKRANYSFNRYGVDDIPDGTPAIPLDDIIDVKGHLQSNGQFTWLHRPASGRSFEWVIRRSALKIVRPRIQGVGLECDKYSATRHSSFISIR